MQRRRELTFKLPLYPLIFGSYFYPLTFALPFQVLSLGIFFFSSKRKEKKTTKKKKKYICREGRELTFKLSLYPHIFDSCSCPPTFALLFQAFSPDIFFFSNIRKKNTKKKKTIEKKIHVEKGGSLPFFSCFYIWGEAFLLFSPLHIPSMLSSLHLSHALCLCLLEALCYSSSGALLSFGDGVSEK
jgi:preprotein translocase subunit YajC